MLLIGLTSEVDTPDWADQGVRSMTWWLSHGEHIQKANNREGLFSSLSVNVEKQRIIQVLLFIQWKRRTRHKIVGALFPILCPYPYTICSFMSMFNAYYLPGRDNIFLIWIKLISSTSKCPFSPPLCPGKTHPTANGTQINKDSWCNKCTLVMLQPDRIFCKSCCKAFLKLMLSIDLDQVCGVL